MSSCPQCKQSWDDGDILEVLTGLRDSGKSYIGWSDAALRDAAAHYGWTAHSPKRFTKLIRVKPDRGRGQDYWMCPHCSAEFKERPNAEARAL